MHFFSKQIGTKILYPTFTMLYMYNMAKRSLYRHDKNFFATLLA